MNYSIRQEKIIDLTLNAYSETVRLGSCIIEIYENRCSPLYGCFLVVAISSDDGLEFMASFKPNEDIDFKPTRFTIECSFIW